MLYTEWTARLQRRPGGIMTLFTWILLGLVSGFIASHLVNHHGEGIVLDVLLGIVGAIVGGWVFHMFRHRRRNEFEPVQHRCRGLRVSTVPSGLPCHPPKHEPPLFLKRS